MNITKSSLERDIRSIKWQNKKTKHKLLNILYSIDQINIVDLIRNLRIIHLNENETRKRWKKKQLKPFRDQVNWIN